MRIYETALIKVPKNYTELISGNDNEHQIERVLHITDDDGNTVKLKQDQIGELYRMIKSLAK